MTAFLQDAFAALQKIKESPLDAMSAILEIALDMFIADAATTCCPPQWSIPQVLESSHAPILIASNREAAWC